MAKFAVGSFKTSASTYEVTYNLGVSPVVGMFLTQSSAAANTTNRVAAFGFCAATSLGSIADERFVYSVVRSEFTGTSARVASDFAAGSGFAPMVGVSLDSAGVRQSVSRTTAAAGASSFGVASSGVLLSTDQPVAYALWGGDDVQGKRVTHTLSTVIGTTHASTGYGFQPNAAFVIGHLADAVQNRASFSFGFACEDSAGTKSQWAVGGNVRSTNNFQATREASSANCLMLMDSTQTMWEASVTSFRADGLEITESKATTQAQYAGSQIGVLGLSVPRVAAGVGTVTTNGVGAGQTGFTVTGLGPNVGMVCVATMWSSIHTRANSEVFSIGFASSNGSQRSVSGAVSNASTNSAGYFSSSHAIVNVSAGGFVQDRGTIAMTSDGFTLTMDSTVDNTARVFWAAFMNTVTDLEAHIFSSASLSAAVNELQNIAAAITANSSLHANVSEVQRLSASIGSTFDISVALEKEFETARGFSKATAEIGARLRVFEEGEEFESNLIRFTNTTSPDITYDVDVTTDRHRVGLAEYQNARFLQIVPPTTNTVPWRVAAGRTSPGVPLHPEVGVGFAIKEDAGTDVYVFTTVQGVTLPKVRVILR